ncbi:nucleotide exchange factor GrpE [Candidatus Atelocyanobacterium thalassae]|uniref:Protein GrpE n=1 Tax=cyanobacterium endosymbiont of Braarudosphaera bigelowii TaxID=1285375 RepID=A0ABM7U4R1_9CHRO|nr:nucleotide exchange factor GrpE [Candidatus Atelocyanobacterium thalassa]BDA39360.1 protein GrpE [cyanobacterium endosymbiont of Braarudosphaera bigelowii]
MTDEKQQIEINQETSKVEEAYNSSTKVETNGQVETSSSTNKDLMVGEDVELVDSEAELEKNLVSDLTEKINDLEAKLQEHNQQYETLNNNHLRVNAEFDNYRKRSIKEKEDLEIKVKCKTISELLSVVDNFERARNSINPTNDGEATIHKSYQGVYKTLVDSLKRLGVGPMRPEGEIFNPLYHEAMLREYTNEYPEGTIIQELMRGYMLGEQVLRHSMVKVAAPQTSDSLDQKENLVTDKKDVEK